MPELLPTSAPLRTRWNCYPCILKTYLFVLQPTSAFIMWNFVTADASSRSDVLDLLDSMVPRLWRASPASFEFEGLNPGAAPRCVLKGRILDFKSFQSVFSFDQGQPSKH